MTTVVAGLIEREGRLLVCRRRADQRHPLQWEFPGGKVEPGEEPRAALTRELEEELGIRGATGAEIERYRFQYPGRNPIVLIFYRVERFEGEPRNLIFEEIRWELPERLPQYDFVEGDLAFLRRLAATC
ncbi:MAG: (deoxy)nucleoside triphosphate pyrophosphohydrolase [Acidobacteria bacterium]|nr:(deoxy)nucleoside triphosphate pyrophosphohydrolase [Acidobacteriota bacterium]